MIWGYNLIEVIYSEALHSLSGLFLLAVLFPTYLDLYQRKKIWDIILLSLFLFCAAWLLHILLDNLQNIF